MARHQECVKSLSLTIHDQADPLVPVAGPPPWPRTIEGAQIDVVPGMGHDLPVQLLPRFADAIAGVAAVARG